MNDLFTPQTKATVLKKRFIGRHIALVDILDKPIEVIDFEIGKSERTGKELLYLQLKVGGQPRMSWSEGCLLISTIKAANRVELPFKTKIIQDGKRYLRFAKCE